MLKSFKLFWMICGAYSIIKAENLEKEKGLNLNFHQNDYQLVFERIELVDYNKDFVKQASVVTRKYNRTQPVTNATFTFKKNLGNDLTFIVQAYRFMSNEYRHFPLRFNAHLCKAFDADTVGLTRMFKCGNFTGCPLVKDKVNHFCNFYPDDSKFPPMIPNGHYKVEIQFNYFSEEVTVVNMFVVISRPICKEMKSC